MEMVNPKFSFKIIKYTAELSGRMAGGVTGYRISDSQKPDTGYPAKVNIRAPPKTDPVYKI